MAGRELVNPIDIATERHDALNVNEIGATVGSENATRAEKEGQPSATHVDRGGDEISSQPTGTRQTKTPVSRADEESIRRDGLNDG